MLGGHVVRKKDLLYPELSYSINGVLFEVFKQVGAGLLEKHYQTAVVCGLKEKGINFVEQMYIPITYHNNFIGKRYVDFLIEKRIVLELKRGQFVPAQTIQQANDYLKLLNLQLAIIACFTAQGVHTRRIVNLIRE